MRRWQQVMTCFVVVLVTTVLDFVFGHPNAFASVCMASCVIATGYAAWREWKNRHLDAGDRT